MPSRRGPGERCRVGYGQPVDGRAAKNAGIDPAPHRESQSWQRFLKAQAPSIIACDLCHHPPTRPTGPRVTQAARNLLMDLDQRAGELKFLIRDRGAHFTTSFDAIGSAD